MNQASGNAGTDNGKRTRRRLILLVGLAIFLLGLVAVFVLLNASLAGDNSGVGTATAQGEGSPPAAAHNTPTAVADPGLVVIGYVRTSDGKGVENVNIFRRYASYPGVLIATTDASGYYQSAFYSIPGDEMVTLWAESAGKVFDPEYDYWRHYYGYEISQHDFTIR